MPTAEQRRLPLPPAPPRHLSPRDRERYAIRVIADVAARQLDALPPSSFPRRVLGSILHEFDEHYAEPANGGPLAGRF